MQGGRGVGSGGQPHARTMAAKQGKVCMGCSRHKLPIIKAAASGHFRCVQLLQLGGADMAARDDTGATALHAAVRTSHIECAMYLVDRCGADLFAV